ncbi:MAG: chlorite dismutase family protein [Polyangiaceae bacterium]
MSDPNSGEPKPEAAKLPGLPPIDVLEYGGKKDGERQSSARRLFMQLTVFDAVDGASAETMARDLPAVLREKSLASVLYADTVSPTGFGLLSWSEDPAHFVTRVRPIFATKTLASARVRNDFAMFGRTYSTGHEPDLEFVLLRRPIVNVTNENYPWHVWYPLRRSGAFSRVEPIEQSHMMREHAAIGLAYGQQELAHDVRLACHGIDANDNEFVIGLVGHDLHPLSHLVQAMRKTRQTSEFIEKMGPFFVGHVLARTPG